MHHLKNAIKELSELKHHGNFLDVELIINRTTLDITGMRHNAIIKIRQPEQWETILAARSTNLKRRGDQIANILIPYIPQRFKRCKMYQSFVSNYKY